jgi:hypothetical protein
MLMRCAIIFLGLSLAGCSSALDEIAQDPSPDVAKAISAIKVVADEYHLTGQLQVAGPIEAPAISLIPWVICLRGASESRFTVALFFKGDAYISSRESVLSDRCDSQTYRPVS